MVLYYFDTCIWLDLFENRNGYLPRGNYAKACIGKIIQENEKILVTNIIVKELIQYGYSPEEIQHKFSYLRRILLYKVAERKELGKAKDIAKKRNLPTIDVLHAYIAKRNQAILVTRDKHFLHLQDLCASKKPEEISGVS